MTDEELQDIPNNKDIEDIPDIEDEDYDEEEEEEQEREKIARCINIHTLNTQVEITSNDPNDTLEKIRDIAERLVDKYNLIKYSGDSR